MDRILLCVILLIGVFLLYKKSIEPFRKLITDGDDSRKHRSQASRDEKKDHLSGPVEINNKIDNYFSVDLPKSMIGSKVVVQAGDQMFEKVFDGYLLKFYINKKCKIIDSIDVHTPKGKKYSGYNRDVKSIFTIGMPFPRARSLESKASYGIPSKNINEHPQQISSYYLGNRTGKMVGNKLESCIHKRKYRTFNNRGRDYNITGLIKSDRKPKVNLMTAKNPSPIFKASYDQGARGQHYYDTEVNQYKAEIDIGQPNNHWKYPTCVKNMPYTKFNNKNTFYDMSSNVSEDDNNIVANLLLPPEKENESMTKISYTGDQRGNNSNIIDDTGVYNKEYTRYNNYGNNYSHPKEEQTCKTGKVNLINPPDKRTTYSVNYYSMNRGHNLE